MFVEYKEIFNTPTTAQKGAPFLNESMPGTGMGNVTSQPYDYSKIVSYIRKSSECLGIFRTIITDIVSDGVFFEAHFKTGVKNKNGKNKVKDAELFYREQQVKEETKAAMLDWMMLGDCAIWNGLSKKELKECYAGGGLEFKEDEDMSSSRKFRHVAWSTMRINHDSRNITGYSQVTVSGGPIADSQGNPIPGKFQNGQFVLNNWDTETIMHGMFMRVDGKVYGYTPTIAIMPEISTLQLIKDYAGTFFQNSGIPDWMFILPKEMAGSPNITELEQKLKIWQNSQDKHRNLVFAGEVQPQKLNEFRQDMEFRQLAVYYTAIMAFAFGLPMGKIQSILGMENTASDSDMASESYWRNIAEAQDYWENLLNSQFWIPFFGVEMKFNRSYLQDEIRESQNRLFLIDGLTKLRSMGIKVTDSYIKRVLKMKDEDIKVIEENPEFLGGGGLGRQSFLPNSQTMGNAELSQKKTQEQAKKQGKEGLKSKNT
jgi:hypothetical protein|tara:strand:+ start:4896 stop:6350 length:1455 start_codon:yes stop_codon:yes gene_type:complete